MIFKWLALKHQYEGLSKNFNSEDLKVFNSIRKRLAQVQILLNFEENFFAEQPIHTCFFLLADKWGLQLKINLFGGATVNYDKEMTSPFSPV